jgi:hypothetical protein
MELPSLAALLNYCTITAAALEDSARNPMPGPIWGLSSVAGTLSMTTALENNYWHGSCRGIPSKLCKLECQEEIYI